MNALQTMEHRVCQLIFMFILHMLNNNICVTRFLRLLILWRESLQHSKYRLISTIAWHSSVIHNYVDFLFKLYNTVACVPRCRFQKEISCSDSNERKAQQRKKEQERWSTFTHNEQISNVLKVILLYIFYVKMFHKKDIVIETEKSVKRRSRKYI